MDKDTYRKKFVPRNSESASRQEVRVGFDVIDVVDINEPKVCICILVRNTLISFDIIVSSRCFSH